MIPRADQDAGSDLTTTVLVVDGLWCSSCILSLEASIQAALPTGFPSFRSGTNLLEISSATPGAIEGVRAQIEQLGYQAYAMDQYEAYAAATAQQGKAEAKQLAMISFFAAWLGTLAWVSYISTGMLNAAEEQLLKAVMLITFVPIIIASAPALITSCLRAVRLRKLHIDMVILGGMACSIGLALQTMIQPDSKTFFLDSTSMSLFLVFAARFVGNRRRGHRTSMTINHSPTVDRANPKTIEKLLEKAMGALLFLSFFLSFCIWLIRGDLPSGMELYSLIMIWPLAACPCLLSACTELTRGLGLRHRPARVLLFMNTVCIGIFNATAVTLAMLGELPPKTLSILMISIVLTLLIVNAIPMLRHGSNDISAEGSPAPMNLGSKC